MTVITRFAPSPTGLLHVGNARTALFCWLFAKVHKGQFMLRLDDTDRERSTEEFSACIIRDLEWLGLNHDMIVQQSDRSDAYHQAFEKLMTQGLVYSCYETSDILDRKRKRLLSRGLPPIYDRTGLNLTHEEKRALEKEGCIAHWRFKLSGKRIQWDDLVRGQQIVDTKSLSDPIIRRGDGSFLYTLPSVVDDIDFAITHVIRGEDHVTNSAIQVEIIQALGEQVPVFAHHPLLVMADGTALSKRLDSLSLASLREEGIEAMAINSLIARLGVTGACEMGKTLTDITQNFSLSQLGRAPVRFDPLELLRLNAKLLHNMPYDEVMDRLKKFDITEGEDFWNAIRGNIEKIDDVEDLWMIAKGNVTPVIAECDKEYIALAYEHLPIEPWSQDTWQQWVSILKEITGRKGKFLFLPLRQALTGQSHGPEMHKLLWFIGLERAKERLNIH